MEAKYHQEVQDCARIEKEIAATQRTRLELIKRLEQYNLHASDDVTIQVPDYYHELVMAGPVRSDILA